MAREVEARLRLSAVDRTAKAFNSVQGKLAAVERKTSAYNRTQMAASQAVRQTEASMLAYGRTMGAIAVGGGLVSAIRTTAEYESRLTSIRKKLGGSAEDVAKLGEEAKNLATSGELAVPLEEILSAYERGAAAGLPLNELREFAKLSAKAADAFEMSAEDVGNAAAGFRVSMGIPISQMEKYFDIINGLADSGISDERDIVGFLDRSGATLKTFGLANEEIAALGATLLNLKMPAEVGARAMNTLATKLLVPEATKKSTAAFKELYGDADNFTQLLKKDSRGALVDFLKRIKELDKFAQAEILTDILGQGFSDEVQRLAGGLDELLRNLTYADSKDWFGSLGKSYELKLKDFNSQWEIFKSQVGELTIDVGLRGLPALKDGLGDIQKTLRTHQTLWDAYQKGKVNFLQALGLGVGQDDVDRLEAEKAKIAAYRDYGRSRLAAPDLPPAAAGAAAQSLPSSGPTPTWRPDGGAGETFEQSYIRQNRAYFSAARPMPLPAPGKSFRDAENASMDAYTRNQGDIQDAVAIALGRDKTDAEPWIDVPYLTATIGDAVSTAFNSAINVLGTTGEHDPDSLRQAMEGGGQAAGTSIREAAYEVNKAGGEAGSAFARMMEGVGAQIGRQAAESFKANVGTLNVQANVRGVGGSLSGRNLGQTMPSAGTTSSGAERRTPGGQP